MGEKLRQVVRVVFVESEHRGTPSSGRRYDYFVPSFLAHNALTVGQHVVVHGADDRLALVRIEEILEPGARNKSTKPVIGLVDTSAHDAKIEEVRRRHEIISQLEALDAKRREMAKYEELAANSPDARELVNELKRLDDTYGKKSSSYPTPLGGAPVASAQHSPGQ